MTTEQTLVTTDAEHPDGSRTLKEAVRVFERQMIFRQLQRNDFDKRRVAKMLGISISSLYRKISELSLDDDGSSVSMEEESDKLEGVVS